MSDDEIIAVVQAHKEGKQIQVFPKWACKEWIQTYREGDTISWNFHMFDYRVKPKPDEPQELWLQSCGGGLWQEKFIGLGRRFISADGMQAKATTEVKPEPRKPREWTVGLTGDGQIVSWRTSLAECNSTIRVREVIDD